MMPHTLASLSPPPDPRKAGSAMKAVLSSLPPARVLFTRLMRRLGRTPYFGPLSTVYMRDVPPPPPPGPGEVRIRNRLCGVCGSDLPFVLGEGGFRIAPAAITGAGYA